MNLTDHIPFVGDEDGEDDDDEEISAGRRPIWVRLFGGWFRRKHKDSSYIQSKKRHITQARMDKRYEEYLSQTLVINLLSGLFAALLATLLIVMFADTIESLSLGIHFPSGVREWIVANKLLLQALVIIPAITLIIGSLTGIVTLYWPRYLANERRRAIDSKLPFLIFYMLTLSKGGRNIVAVIDEASEATDIYGEAAEELSAVANSVSVGMDGNLTEDLLSALHIEAQNTASKEVKNLYNDIRGAISTGSDVATLLENRSDEAIEEMFESAQRRLEFIELFSEMYVQLAVFPMFIAIIGMTNAFLGSSDMLMLYVITYVYIPAIGFILIFIIKTAASRPSVGGTEIAKESFDELDGQVSEEDLQEEAKYTDNFSIRESTREFRTFLSNPLTYIYKELRANPLLTAGITFPIAALTVFLFVTAGIVEPSLDAFHQRPIWTTTFLVTIPVIIIALLPIDLIHTMNLRRQKKINSHLPKLLGEMEEASRSGRTLTQSIERYARDNNNLLANEMEKAVNVAAETGRLSIALKNAANNLQNPRLTRTMKMITKAKTTANDVSPILKITRKDNETQEDLDQEQFSKTFMYIFIIGMANIVVAGVLVAIDAFFLSMVTDLSSGAGGGAGQMNINIDAEAYRLTFYHLSYLSSFFGGLFAAVIWRDDVIYGIKIGTAMVVLATILFIVVPMLM